MNTPSEKEITEHLKGFVTPQRLEKMLAVLQNRTRYLTVVLEDIFQPHNASAVLRSCDACGIQDVHIIENRNRHKLTSGIELGTAQWLTRYRYRQGENKTMEAIQALRDKGYRIVATTPHKNDVSPAEFDLAKGPAALLFGTELEGLSQQALDAADEYIRIPMYGFVESYNISVSVAIIVSRLKEKLQASGLAWQLSETESDELLLQYLRNSVRESGLIEKRFASEKAAT